MKLSFKELLNPTEMNIWFWISVSKTKESLCESDKWAVQFTGNSKGFIMINKMKNAAIVSCLIAAATVVNANGDATGFPTTLIENNVLYL